MKALRKAVCNYIKLRRGMGYKLEIAEVRLGQFVDFMQAKKAFRITAKLAASKQKNSRQKPQAHVVDPKPQESQI